MPKLRSRLAVMTDEGVSLIEIIVAISIVAIIATASAGIVINGIAAAATQERRQVAVTIASGLIETVSAKGADISPTTTVTSAVTGRSQASVLASWAANAGKLGVATTTPAFDPTATAASTVSNLISPPSSNLSGTTYTSTVLIGTCYQQKVGGDCVVVATPTATVTQLVRVIVIVRWTPGTSCVSNECFYQTSTLLDPNRDLEWVTGG